MIHKWLVITKIPWFNDANTVGIITDGITFSCTMDGGTTDHAYPRRSDPKYNAFNLGITTFTTDTFTVNVGVSTIVNYNVSNASYTPSTGQLTLNIGAHSLKSGVTTTVQSADYSPVTGIMTVTIANREYSAGERIKFDTESLDSVALLMPDIKAYPGVNDYANNKWLPISNVTANTFEVQVLGIQLDIPLQAQVFIHLSVLLEI